MSTRGWRYWMNAWGKKTEQRSRRFYHSSALLPHKLGDVIGPAPPLPRRSRALPPAERLRAGPGTRGGAGALVGIADTCLDLVEEALDLFRPLRKYAGPEPEFHFVRLGQRLVETANLAHRDEGHEQLFAVERARERQPSDGGCHEVALVEHAAREACAPGQDGSFLAGLGNRLLVPGHGLLVDHRAEVDVALGRIAHLDRRSLGQQRLHERLRHRPVHVHSRRGAAFLI